MFHSTTKNIIYGRIEHYRFNDESGMESILYGIILIGVASLIFFGYRFLRRVGLRCVERGEKVCAGNTISEFYTAEDQQKNKLEI